MALSITIKRLLSSDEPYSGISVITSRERQTTNSNGSDDFLVDPSVLVAKIKQVSFSVLNRHRIRVCPNRGRPSNLPLPILPYFEPFLQFFAQDRPGASSVWIPSIFKACYTQDLGTNRLAAKQLPRPFTRFRSGYRSSRTFRFASELSRLACVVHGHWQTKRFV